jgi:hypothetical protein
MYARIDHLTSQPDLQDHGPDIAGLSASVAGLPGLRGSLTFRQLAGPAVVFLTLWDTEARAASFSGPRPSPARLPGEVYEVIAAEQGQAAAQAPAYARLLYFDGPQAPEQAAAADRAGRQRIWPAIRGLSGLVGICCALTGAAERTIGAVGPQSTGQRAQWFIWVRKRSFPVERTFWIRERM